MYDAAPTVDFRAAALGLWSPVADPFGHGLPPEVELCDPAGRVIPLRSHRTWLATMRIAFPDLTTVIEDYVSCGTSALVRLRHCAEHAGEGYYGPPTKRRVLARSALALDACGPEVSSVLVLRDLSGIHSALGLGVRDEAARLPPVRPRMTETEAGGIANPWAETYADLLSLMMEGDFSVPHRAFDPACTLTAPEVSTTGPQGTERFWLGLRAAFPTADFTIARAIGEDGPLSSPRAALLWRLSGAHEGWGRYGAPTGRTCVVTGISFAEFGPRGLRRESTVIDDLSVWQQIGPVRTSARASG